MGEEAGFGRLEVKDSALSERCSFLSLRKKVWRGEDESCGQGVTDGTLTGRGTSFSDIRGSGSDDLSSHSRLFSCFSAPTGAFLLEVSRFGHAVNTWKRCWVELQLVQGNW